MRNRRSLMFFVVVGALVAASGVAAAAEDDDTTFSYGYDEENRLLLINTSPYDATTEEATCQLDTDLEDDAGTEYELTYSSLTEPVAVEPLTVDDDTCELEAAEVSGPNGQINHGMFMKAFKDLYDGPRRGCVNRYLAQTDLGKGDQQIQADPESEFEAETNPSSAEFFTALADCENENGDDEQLSELSNGNGNGKGRPDSPGKSASAPGHGG